VNPQSATVESSKGGRATYDKTAQVLVIEASRAADSTTCVEIGTRADILDMTCDFLEFFFAANPRIPTPRGPS
jgi:hypothetical protein